MMLHICNTIASITLLSLYAKESKATLEQGLLVVYIHPSHLMIIAAFGNLSVTFV